MQRILFIVVFLLLAYAMYAEYVPQQMLFETVNEINITEQFSDSLETDCGWFDNLSSVYKINQLELLYDYQKDTETAYWYFIAYKDSIDADSLDNIFILEPKVIK